VRKTGHRVRITAQLIEAATGAHLWADHFDGLFEEVFELQDQVAVSAAGVIEPTLQASEVRRSSARQTRDLTAYDFYLRALAKFPWMRKEQLLAGCGKSRDFGKTVMKRARNGNSGLIKSTGYEGAKGDESGWKHHRPTFSAAC